MFAFRVSCFGEGMGFWSSFCWKLGMLFLGCELLGLPVNSNNNKKASIQVLGRLKDLGCTWLDHCLILPNQKGKRSLSRLLSFW